MCLLLLYMFIRCHQKAEQNMMTFNKHRLRIYEKKRDGEVKDGVRRDGWKKLMGELHNMYFNIHYYVETRRSRKRQLWISRSRWNIDMNFKHVGREGV